MPDLTTARYADGTWSVDGTPPGLLARQVSRAATPADPVKEALLGGAHLPRRQFLWRSAVFGAGAAERLPWPAPPRPVGLGIIGLGCRGARALAVCRSIPGAAVVALCDQDAAALRRQGGVAGDGGAEPRLATDPHRLLHEPGVEAVVLAVGARQQLALAAAACEAGKDVLLLRPAALDGAALRALAALAGRHQRQVHFARACRCALDRGTPRGTVLPCHQGTASALVRTRLQTPLPLGAGGLLHELIDEADLALAVLGGEVVRAVAASGAAGRGDTSRAPRPRRYLCERRVHLELAGRQGPRRSLTLALAVEHGPVAVKTSRILLRCSRGAARLTAVPVAGCDPADLRAFVHAVHRREPGPGLTAERLRQLTEQVLAGLREGNDER